MPPLTNSASETAPEHPFELANLHVRRGNFQTVLFDFDGTISLIRQGWREIMIPMMVEIIADIGTDESTDELSEKVADFVDIAFCQVFNRVLHAGFRGHFVGHFARILL